MREKDYCFTLQEACKLINEGIPEGRTVTSGNIFNVNWGTSVAGGPSHNNGLYSAETRFIENKYYLKPQQLKRMAINGEIDCERFGKKTYFAKQDIDRLHKERYEEYMNYKKEKNHKWWKGFYIFCVSFIVLIIIIIVAALQYDKYNTAQNDSWRYTMQPITPQ